MTERLKEAVDNATQLPPEQQDQIAEQIEAAIENAVWDAQLRDPRYQPIIVEMAARVLQEEPRPMPTLRDFGLIGTHREYEKIIKGL
jgi:hypothetical protein